MICNFVYKKLGVYILLAVKKSVKCIGHLDQRLSYCRLSLEGAGQQTAHKQLTQRQVDHNRW